MWQCETAMPSYIWFEQQRVYGALECLKGNILQEVREWGLYKYLILGIISKRP